MRAACRRRPPVLATVAMAAVVLLTLYPLLWMVAGALKDQAEFYQNIWGMPRAWAWHNFAAAWRRAALAQKYANSLLVTLATLAIAVPLTSLAAYALATMRFAGRRAVYVYLLLGIMVPFGVTAIPTFTTLLQFGLLNTRLGLALVYAAQSLSFGIFLMYSFFETLPQELEEAARIDGCTRLGAFWRVILPLARPGLATQVVFTGITAWNEYFMASILIHDDALQTLPLGLVTFTGRYVTNYPELFAALSMVTLPVIAVYLLAQRQFISGMTAGAVKG
jgi:ABC-type glycerol-3-phosphate transport system permease component